MIICTLNSFQCDILTRLFFLNLVYRVGRLLQKTLNALKKCFWTSFWEDGIALLQKRFSLSELDVSEATVCMSILRIDTLPTYRKKIGDKQ
jgi:hypothetical protein